VFALVALYTLDLDFGCCFALCVARFGLGRFGFFFRGVFGGAFLGG
jgi:hypothetical protein